MPRFVLPLLLALAGLVLFGQGAYIHAKALVAQMLLERAFTHTVTTGRETKPWPWADTWPVARIEVKRIGASAIVLAGSSGQALAFGPGHVELTPDAGERGVAVYSAHRDTHFRFLKDVKIGDEIDVTRHDGKTFRYRADGSSVVRTRTDLARDVFGSVEIDPLSTEPGRRRFMVGLSNQCFVSRRPSTAREERNHSPTAPSSGFWLYTR